VLNEEISKKNSYNEDIARLLYTRRFRISFWRFFSATPLTIINVLSSSSAYIKHHTSNVLFCLITSKLLPQEHDFTTFDPLHQPHPLKRI